MECAASGWRARWTRTCCGISLSLFAVSSGMAQAPRQPAVVRLGAPGAAEAGPSLPRMEKPPAGTQTSQLDVKALPISLDTVLRLAQDRNGQLAIARQKLEEAFAQQDLAAKKWLPELTFGPSYYRHEGGIQDFSGQFIHSSYGSLFAGMQVRGKIDAREAAYYRIDAERKVWQQKGEVSKLTSETLLDAAGTYIDFLAARSSEAVSLASAKELDDLGGLAQRLAKVDPGLRVEVVRVRSEIQGQQLMSRKLREGANKAAAKLSYLLNLDPASSLVPVDGALAAFDLVDSGLDTPALVAQALAVGPGVREMQGLLGLIEDTRAKASGPGRFIPSLELFMAEGGFGAGPGSQSTWDNRWDLGLQLKWNLTDLVTARQRRRVADSQSEQARLGYDELRAKLTLGVREAHESSRSGKEQIRLGQEQIREAEEAYQLSNSRLKETIKGSSPSEVLMAIRGLAGARLLYLQSLHDYDQAQLRLFVLVCLYSQKQPRAR